MATHSSIFAWKIAWTEESGELQSIGPHRVRHDRATKHACPSTGTSASSKHTGPLHCKPQKHHQTTGLGSEVRDHRSVSFYHYAFVNIYSKPH